jgi:hypothetical protein
MVFLLLKLTFLTFDKDLYTVLRLHLAQTIWVIFVMHIFYQIVVLNSFITFPQYR